MVRNRRNRRRRTNASRQGILFSLILLMVFGFILLNVLAKWKGRLGEDEEVLSAEVVHEELEAVIEKAVVEEKIEKPIAFTAAAPKIAIIIDDVGYSMKIAAPLFTIEYPLTMAILPNLRYSTSLAKKISQFSYFETMLHLPLESREGKFMERGTILTDMDEDEVRFHMEGHLQPLLPYIKGVNNHMGSKATADKRLMKTILEEIKKRNLYFIDSYTTNKSVIAETVQALGLKFARRQVFLDSGLDFDKDNPDYVRARLDELAELARKEGQAIGIGHVKVATLEALQEMMPKMAEEGIRFVKASELVE